MKKIPLAIISLAILTLILGGCPDVLSGKPDFNRPAAERENDIPNGFGALRVKVTPGNARTALPAELLLEKLSLKYYFTKIKDKDGHDISVPKKEEYTDPVVDNKFILEAGTYHLEIKAYDKEDDAVLVAEGYGPDNESIIVIKIEDGKVNETKVTLRPSFEGGKGTLSFTINTDVPTAKLAVFSLTDLFDGTFIDLYNSYYVPNQPAFNEPVTYPDNIPAGYYLLQIQLKKDAVPGSLPPYARKSEVVHIYKNLTTVTEYTFIDSDFITDLLVTSAADDGPGSLRDVLKNADDGKIIRIKLPPSSTIILESSLKITKDITIVAEDYAVTITRYIDDDPDNNFRGSFFIIGDDTKSGTLTLGGNGSTDITIDGKKNKLLDELWIYAAVLINVNNGELVMNEGVTLQNNSNSGVYVDVNGTFTMKGGTISGNEAEYNGGGVFVDDNGTFNMTDGIISGNKTGHMDGGGVYVAYSGSTFTMDGGTIYNNEAAERGGGVHVSGGTFTMKGGTISGNIAASDGGGVLVVMGTFNMSAGTISSNTATENGGGVEVFEGTFNMSAGTIGGDDKNTAQKGGGVYVFAGTFNMSGSAEVSGNEAGVSGGGVYVSGYTYSSQEYLGTFIMTGGTVVKRNTASSGGGVYVSEYGDFNMTSGTIGGEDASDGNTAFRGGGVYVGDSTGTFTMSGGEISYNKADVDSNGERGIGGGVVVNDGTFEMSTGTISGNTATSNGGGVYVANSSTFTMSGGTIGGEETKDANTAKNGGGVYVYNGEFAMEYGTISYNKINKTSSGGGAGNGGGVYVYSGKFTMVHGTISYNEITDNAPGGGSGGGGGVYVAGTADSPGTFTMEYGTISYNEITTNNSANSCYGGGVYVSSGGTFTMEGTAVLSNNTVVNTAGGSIANGGGVCVSGSSGAGNSGTFNMKGGEIKLNTAKNGGGVYVNSYGKFQIENGTVYGEGSDKNTATSGVALCFGSFTPLGTAQYGTLRTDGTWDITNGDLTTTNDTIKVVKGVLLEMIYIPSGNFEMGKDLGGGTDITPVHTVTLTTGFYMGKYPVTQELYQAVMESNPSYYKTAVLGEDGTPGKLPVEQVGWYDAIVFCNKLSIAEGLSPAYRISGSTDPDEWGTVPESSDNTTWNSAAIIAGSNGYRLPTEAQWEYAAKGGSTPENYTYAGSNTIDDVAWRYANSGGKSHEVGKKFPNGLGLYDMSGNVQEWCWDRHGNYSNGAQTDPMGATTGNARVLRGGSFNDGDINYSMRSVSRIGHDPNFRNFSIGFRLVRP